MSNFRYCHNCSTSVPPHARFCPNCRAKQHLVENTNTIPTEPSILPPGISPHPVVGTGRLPAGIMLHNRYRLVDKVGQGYMGAVYIAKDTRLGNLPVAVKEMSTSRISPQDLPQAVEMFKREAHLLARLRHPNLPIIYDHFNEKDRWYLVMDYIQGDTLQTHLDATPGHKLPMNEVVRIGMELCNALDYLHSSQILFRDLKPRNIMITPQRQIYLIDFGITRHFKMEAGEDTAYHTPGYAPLEQYGQAQTGPHSDIYSLGVTLYQMLTGHNPSDRPFQFLAIQLLDPTIPAPLANLITYMLDINEQRRPPSAAVVRAELEKVSNQLSHPETSPPIVKPPEEPKPINVPIDNPHRPPNVPIDNPHHPPLENTDLTWEKVLSTRSAQYTLWICFILLNVAFSLLAILQSYTTPFLDDTLGVAAAGVGAIFFLTKELREKNKISTIIGTFVTAFSLRLSLSFYQYSDTLQRSLIATFSLIALLIGICLFLPKASYPMRITFGALLFIIGIIIFFSQPLLPSTFGIYAFITSLVQASLGGLIFLIASFILAGKITRNTMKKSG
jgi:serine/threonine protein kinase